MAPGTQGRQNKKKGFALIQTPHDFLRALAATSVDFPALMQISRSLSTKLF
jgi:hypothetical protein